EQRAEAAKPAETRVVTGTSPSHALEDYVGAYEHPGYGVLLVSKSPQGLESRLGELDLSMTYRHFDTWTARYEPFGEEFPMTCVTNADGEVAEVVSSWEPLVAPIRFARRVDEPKT